jgi:hypothetical protein
MQEAKTQDGGCDCAAGGYGGRMAGLKPVLLSSKAWCCPTVNVVVCFSSKHDLSL